MPATEIPPRSPVPAPSAATPGSDLYDAGSWETAYTEMHDVPALLIQLQDDLSRSRQREAFWIFGGGPSRNRDPRGQSHPPRRLDAQAGRGYCQSRRPDAAEGAYLPGASSRRAEVDPTPEVQHHFRQGPHGAVESSPAGPQ